jgi:hypothetical protein
MIICLIYALVALIVALIVIAIIEWGLAMVGFSLPANIIMLIRVLVGLLWLIYVLGCFLPFFSGGGGGVQLYPGHPHGGY